MNRFGILRRYLLILLPFVLFLVILEVILRDTDNSYIIKKKYFDNSKDKIDILITGSSQSLWGVNPAFIGENAFNLSENGQSLFYDYALLKNKISETPNLKMILLNISYFYLYHDLNDLNESNRMYFYRHYWGIESPYISIFDLGKISFIKAYGLNNIKKISLSGFKDKYFNSISGQGFVPMRNSSWENINNISGNERAKFHNSLI